MITRRLFSISWIEKRKRLEFPHILTDFFFPHVFDNKFSWMGNSNQFPELSETYIAKHDDGLFEVDQAKDTAFVRKCMENGYVIDEEMKRTSKIFIYRIRKSPRSAIICTIIGILVLIVAIVGWPWLASLF